MQVDKLTCEYLADPTGVENLAPKLSWTLLSEKRGDMQTAWQVQAASSPNSLDSGEPDLWDSGQIDSEKSLDRAYQGIELGSGKRVFWRVRVWDKDGEKSAWSKPAHFTMGLLDPSDWSGEWVGAEIGESSEDAAPAVTLRREFDAPKQVKRAQAFICGLGYYELYINGQKVGDHVLDPGFTNYDKRALYVAYDVTEHINDGQNVIGVTLGRGWFDMAVPDVWGYEAAPWRSQPKMILQLNLEYTDDTRQSIASDKLWRTSTEGPIRYNTLRGGETYDARMETPDWNVPGFNDSGWSRAITLPAPKGRLVSQKCPPIKVTETITPTSVTEPKPGVYVVDLGRNIAGWTQIRIRGKAGERIKLVYGERLSPDGTVNQDDIKSLTRGRFATDEYVLRGDGEETWEPRFAYYGFQYIEVTGLSYKPGTEDILGRVVHSSVADTGEFSCSNELVNRLQQVSKWTQLNNLHSIPQDCPHREKNGWMADGLVSSHEAMMNFDMAAFYSKWVDDMADTLLPTGAMGSIVPSPGWGIDGMPGEDYTCPCWGSACVILPWYHYVQYGDREILERNFHMMKAYTDYLGTRAEGHIVEFGLGDWLEEGTSSTPKRTPIPLTGTAFYFYDATVLSRTAEILGHDEDAERYARLAADIKRAFNARFFDPSDGSYGADSQTANALPIAFGMVPEELEDVVLMALMRSVREERDDHVSSGIVGTKFLLDTLADHGLAELAYVMITREGYPGWVHMLEDGATTFWEAWDKGGSLDHPAFACVSGWFYQALAGIRPDENHPGFKKTIIKPHIVGDLDSVKASYDSRYGRIACQWKLDFEELTVDIEVPASTSATLYLPAGLGAQITECDRAVLESPGVVHVGRDGAYQVFSVGSGEYSFRVGI